MLNSLPFRGRCGDTGFVYEDKVLFCFLYSDGAEEHQSPGGISSDEEEEEEEEMLISEEEIPFKDDPRDETYKPHLERHVSDFTIDMLMKNKLGKHCCMLSFHLVAELMGIDLILNE